MQTPGQDSENLFVLMYGLNDKKKARKVECNVICMCIAAEEGKHPWPSVSDLNTRLRRIITSYQRSRKHEQHCMDKEAKVHTH